MGRRRHYGGNAAAGHRIRPPPGTPVRSRRGSPVLGALRRSRLGHVLPDHRNHHGPSNVDVSTWNQHTPEKKTGSHPSAPCGRPAEPVVPMLAFTPGHEAGSGGTHGAQPTSSRLQDGDRQVPARLHANDTLRKVPTGAALLSRANEPAAAEAATIRKAVHQRNPATAGSRATGRCRSAPWRSSERTPAPTGQRPESCGKSTSDSSGATRRNPP